MTEDKNIPTDEITYTPMLSKIFPSFSGTCTKEEFREAWKTGFLSTILWGVLEALVVMLSSDNLYLFITLSLLLLVSFCLFSIKKFLPQVVRRFHSFGMNYTCWYAVPTIALLVPYVLCAISRDNEATNFAVVLMIAWLSYNIWIIRKCYYQDSPEDKKRSALRKKTEVSVSSLKKGKKITSLKKTVDKPDANIGIQKQAKLLKAAGAKK